MISAFSHDAARSSADKIRDRIGEGTPEIAIILGSGLGGLADEIENAVRIPYADIPGFPEATVVGHAGALVSGNLSGRDVLALSGRFHMYEGHPPALAGFPVRVLHELGARTLFASNAAGGIRRDLGPGDLMIIEESFLQKKRPKQQHYEQTKEPKTKFRYHGETGTHQHLGHGLP